VEVETPLHAASNETVAIVAPVENARAFKCFILSSNGMGIG
jgi:hypothetical protein